MTSGNQSWSLLHTKLSYMLVPVFNSIMCNFFFLLSKWRWTEVINWLYENFLSLLDHMKVKRFFLPVEITNYWESR